MEEEEERERREREKRGKREKGERKRIEKRGKREISVRREDPKGPISSTLYARLFVRKFCENHFVLEEEVKFF